VLLRITDEQDSQRPDACGSRLSQHDLAYLVGTTRENVNKCLQEWRRAAIRMTSTVFAAAVAVGVSGKKATALPRDPGTLHGRR
jgi:hypothetical protein